MSNNIKTSLGNILAKAGLITQDVLSIALMAANAMNKYLGETLVEQAILSEQDIENALAIQCLLNFGLVEFNQAKEILSVCHHTNTAMAHWLNYNVVRFNEAS